MFRAIRLPKRVASHLTATCAVAIGVAAVACNDPTAAVNPQPRGMMKSVVGGGGVITASPTGLATAAGTPSAPLSLAKAVTIAPAGATIQLLSGTYRTGNIVIQQPLTIQPAAGATATLTGSVAIPASQWQVAGNAWRTPWTTHFTPPSYETSQYYTSQYPLAGHRDLAFYDGKALTLATSASAVGAGTFFVDTVGKWLYVGQNPSGHTVEATNQQYGLVVYGTNVRVTGLTIQHYAEVGLRVQGTGALIDHNTIQWNGTIGLDFNAVSNATAEDNAILHNGQAGVVSNSSSNVTVAHNNISGNNYKHFNVSWAGAGIKVTQVTNFVFTGNWVADNQANAVWIDNQSTNSTISQNQVMRSLCYGIYFEISSGALIVGNVLHDNTSGIGVHFTTNARVYNNTMVNNGTNLDVSASYNRAPYDLYHSVIVNNIFGPATTRMQNLYRYNGCNSTAYSQIDYNAYYRSAGATPSKEVNWCNTYYATAGAFHTGQGYEGHSLQIDGGPDPFFVSVPAENFHLHAGSPAIGKGQPLPADAAAALGVSVGRAVRIGAVQD